MSSVLMVLHIHVFSFVIFLCIRTVLGYYLHSLKSIYFNRLLNLPLSDKHFSDHTNFTVYLCHVHVSCCTLVKRIIKWVRKTVLSSHFISPYHCFIICHFKCTRIQLQSFQFKKIMCCINIHLNIDLFTFNKYCICKLL